MLRHWPIAGLRLSTPEVELRWPSLADLDELAEVAARGVHDPGEMPFFSHWTDGDPEVVARRVVQRHWNSLGAWTPNDWTLYLVAVHQDQVIGCYSMGARDFHLTREVLGTAWLGLPFQGKGVGTYARAAMLHLAFEGLGAEYSFSVVQRSNTASQTVFKKLGFQADGMQVNQVRGRQVLSDRYRMDRQTWEENRTVPVEIHGLAPALPLFGLTPDNAATTAPVAARPMVTAELLSGVRVDFDGDSPAA
ncbi:MULTISPECIES: GNAT family N-acetyltransferase [unclassified Crossiella]|uniref:GNAT family N-acetyltransferase n=1 Tax=unclassified Crossiella TaxID=2620835 RepID=UPI001FFF1460|nr:MULTISPECIES: GNAT family N-acetyltransferase [unclassified Crossiella]MCK2244146.1 GNAT family N-acetyltransferase [Crossiella sp. S99.2]MCK2257950.1 GNAT family N-acetyltransferase [Crossiella sp. S99.1]